MKQRLWLLVATALLLCSCDKDPDAAAKPEVTGRSTAPLPPLPVWAQQLVGKDATKIYKVTKVCMGAFDVVKVRYSGTPSGVDVAGWAWDSGAKAASEKVLFVDNVDKIVGGAETIMERPDVPKAIPDVTTPKVGWRGLAEATKGEIRAFAILKDGSICEAGAKSL